jgi:hypothetical protein
MEQKQKEIIGMLIVLVIAGIAGYFLLKEDLSSPSNPKPPEIQVAQNPAQTNQANTEATGNLTSVSVIKDLDDLFSKGGYKNDNIATDYLWWIDTDNNVALNIRTNNALTYVGVKSKGENYNLDTFKNDSNIMSALKMVDNYMSAHEFTKQEAQNIDAHPEWNSEYNHFYNFTEGFYNAASKLRCRFDLDHLDLGRDDAEGPPFYFFAIVSCVDGKEYKDALGKQAPLLRNISEKDPLIGYPFILDFSSAIKNCQCEDGSETKIIEVMNAGSHDSDYFELKKVNGIWIDTGKGYDLSQCSCVDDTTNP